MNSADIEFFEGGNYMSFATRKKSGDFVATPVWFAPDGDSYYVFSAGNAGKVKRLRNFSESRIAPCTATGTLTGEAMDARAFILESKADQATALNALRRKYGWQMSIGDLFSKITGKMDKRAYIRVELV
ncbi:MAG: PPOX class F420-dependent oxidoreductase [Gammaproteobacteria bacterium]|nr:PPOX class F420-dependent oxidoreductase [Gammaproteobacteria bacterium]